MIGAEKTNTACVFPWLQLYVDNLGLFYPCCVSNTIPSKDEHGKPIFAGDENSIRKHWSSLQMRNLRKNMQDGQRASTCNFCWMREDLGDISFRFNHYKIDPSLFENAAPAPSFKWIDLRFGNSCNLACRMCIPYNSRKLFEEWKTLYGEESVEPFRKMDWFEAESFWLQLKEFTSETERIHLAGGEPLLIKQCWSFLRELVAMGYSKNITLAYNTNLTVLPPEALELWPKFKGIHLLISLDGVGRVNEFIRHPLNWASFEKNVKEIEARYTDYNISFSHFHVTSQAYNIKRIVEICEYASQFKNIDPVPRFEILNSPLHLDALALPKNYREEAAQEIDNYLLKLKRLQLIDSAKNANSLVSNLEALTRYLRQDGYPDRFQEFKRHTDVMDRYRNQRIFDYLPELENAY